MERALSIPSWPASNGPVYSTKTRMPPRRGRSPAKFSTTGTPSPPSSPIPICRPPTTMPRQHSGMRSSQGGSASEREPRKGRALMRPSSASLKPAGGERSMRGVSSQKPSGMPGEANRQRPSRHLPNPGKVNGYDVLTYNCPTHAPYLVSWDTEQLEHMQVQLVPHRFRPDSDLAVEVENLGLAPGYVIVFLGCSVKKVADVAMMHRRSGVPSKAGELGEH